MRSAASDDPNPDLHRNLPLDASAELVKTLLDQIPDDDQTSLITVNQAPLPAPSATAEPQAPRQPAYDPSVAYILEFCSSISMRDEESVQCMGKAVFDAAFAFLRDPLKWHPLTVSRATFHSLSILKRSYVSRRINTIRPQRTDSHHRTMTSSKSIRYFTRLPTYHHRSLGKRRTLC